MFDTFRAAPSVATATPIVEARRSNPFSLMMAGADNQALANALDLLADNLDWHVSGLTDADAALIQGMINAAIEAAKPAPKAAPAPVAAPVVAAPAPVAAPVVTPAISISDLPALTGSDKQVAWASKLRLQAANALAGMKLQPEEARVLWAKMVARTDCRFWIDNCKEARWHERRFWLLIESAVR